jgi:hypothetical protein
MLKGNYVYHMLQYEEILHFAMQVHTSHIILEQTTACRIDVYILYIAFFDGQCMYPKVQLLKRFSSWCYVKAGLENLGLG